MSTAESKGALSKAARDLFSRWADVKTVWSDAQSEAFEKKYLWQIEQDVRTALGALDHMNTALHKIESDCE